jgi:hypothetical protein
MLFVHLGPDIKIMETLRSSQNKYQHTDRVEQGSSSTQSQGKIGMLMLILNPPVDAGQKTAQVNKEFGDQQAGHPGDKYGQGSLDHHGACAADQDTGP